MRSASAPLPLAALERFEKALGVPVVETYGMTEAASMITANPVDGPRKPGSAGRPAGSQVQIELPGGGTAAPGEVGRVRIRGAGVITGYDSGGRPGVIDADGWLDTSDLGYLDADGYLFLVGRADDVINRGGEKIYPREIEEILLAQPGVRSAAVVGAADVVLGERPVAYVVTDAAAVAAEVEAVLREACAAQLPRHKQPSEFCLVGGDAARADGEDLPAAAEGPGDVAAVSSTLSDTGPLAPLRRGRQPAGRPGVAAAPPPRGRRRAARSRPHIIAFDMIRLIIMVFVVGVHTLAWGGGQVTLVLGAVTTVFHTSRELFLLLTALVLTYNYGHRPRLKTLRFWRRRYWLVVPAYVTWSAIYYAADGAAAARSRPRSCTTC